MDTQSLLRDMPANEYHAVQAMSSGGLRRMRQSPAHFYGAMLDPRRPPELESVAKANGTLAHCMLLEQDQFGMRFAVVPDDAPRRPSKLQRKAAKPSPATMTSIAWWDTFEADTAGKALVEQPALDSAMAKASALRSLPEIARLLSSGYAESSAFWLDAETEVLCKCRPDWVYDTGDGVILLDGKTAKDASPDGFARSSWNFRYDLQAAWYSDGFERATGQRVLGFVFGAVESDWPHCAAAYMLPDDVLDAARREIRRLVRQYSDCLQRNHWPGYPAGVTLLTMPRWAQLEIDE